MTAVTDDEEPPQEYNLGPGDQVVPSLVDQKGHVTRHSIHKVYYRCLDKECAVLDAVKLFEGEAEPLSIACWKCHAGLQQSHDHRLMAREGMFPINSEGMEDELEAELHPEHMRRMSSTSNTP